MSRKAEATFDDDDSGCLFPESRRPRGETKIDFPTFEVISFRRENWFLMESDFSEIHKKCADDGDDVKTVTEALY